MTTTRREYIEPKFPDGWFLLTALDGGWQLGPFTREGWGHTLEGALTWADGVTHPVTLRVRSQEGDIIHANDGDMGPMDYLIEPTDGPDAH